LCGQGPDADPWGAVGLVCLPGCVLSLASTLLKAAGSPAQEKRKARLVGVTVPCSHPLRSPSSPSVHPLLFSHPVTGGQARISGAASHQRVRAPSSPSPSERGQRHHPTRGQRSPTRSPTTRGPSHRRRAAYATTRHRHLRGAAAERERGSVVRSGDAGACGTELAAWRGGSATEQLGACGSCSLMCATGGYRSVKLLPISLLDGLLPMLDMVAGCSLRAWWMPTKCSMQCL